MDGIKLFSKNEKELTNNMNIQPGYRNGIWHRKMCHADNEKREKRNCRRNRIKSRMH